MARLRSSSGGKLRLYYLSTVQTSAAALGLPPAQRALERLPAGDPSIASAALRETLAGGVGFHISDLDRDERRVLEQEFRATDSTIRVLAATTTLAMGVNTPASAVVIADLEHPGTPPTPYGVAEYKNIVGRAGRLGFTGARPAPASLYNRRIR